MPAFKMHKVKRILLITFIAGFIAVNVIAFLHASAFTHFSKNDGAKT